MDNIENKVEGFLDKTIAEFKDKPIKSSIKFLIIVWVVKWVYNNFIK